MPCVGNEAEIERMLLGPGTILSHDWATCITAMMDPTLVGSFELWSRFVDPGRGRFVVTILRVRIGRRGIAGVVSMIVRACSVQCNRRQHRCRCRFAIRQSFQFSFMIVRDDDIINA